MYCVCEGKGREEGGERRGEEGGGERTYQSNKELAATFCEEPTVHSKQ